MEKHKIPKIDTNKLKKILKRNKVQKISLFGSFAKSKERNKSDLDFLVEFEKTADLFDMVGLKLDLEELFKRKADVVTPNSLSKYIRRKIIREAVHLHG
jgi:predicted nucleotidyltransferase